MAFAVDTTSSITCSKGEEKASETSWNAEAAERNCAPVSAIYDAKVLKISERSNISSKDGCAEQLLLLGSALLPGASKRMDHNSWYSFDAAVEEQEDRDEVRQAAMKFQCVGSAVGCTCAGRNGATTEMRDDGLDAPTKCRKGS